MDIKTYSKSESTNFLASFLPGGRAMSSKYIPGQNLRALLCGLSGEFKRVNDLIALFLEDIDPEITVNFLEEWESALSIPDGCIPLETDPQDRRDNIVLKLTSLSIQTEADFLSLGAKFGITLTVENNKYPPYDVPFIPFDEKGAKFIWELSGDFASDPVKGESLQCLIKLLIPVNYDVRFIQS